MLIRLLRGQIDQNPRTFVQRLNGIAQPRKEIGADLPSAKNLNRGGKGFQIERTRYLRFSWHDLPSHVFIPSLKVHP